MQDFDFIGWNWDTNIYFSFILLLFAYDVSIDYINWRVFRSEMSKFECGLEFSAMISTVLLVCFLRLLTISHTHANWYRFFISISTRDTFLFAKISKIIVAENHSRN